MKYEVLNIPEGLACNPETGMITGTINTKGEYRTTFRVTNDLGSAEREFKIVCGETLALTPHMGWNSWYVWENHVTDRIMREAADAMVSSGMIDHGYMYVNIDDCWSVKPGSPDSTLTGEPRDKNGMINSNRRFPDMKALTDYIHSKGLKAGIYTSPGETDLCRTCMLHTDMRKRMLPDMSNGVMISLNTTGVHIPKSEIPRILADLQKPYILISEFLKSRTGI